MGVAVGEGVGVGVTIGVGELVGVETGLGVGEIVGLGDGVGSIPHPTALHAFILP